MILIIGKDFDTCCEDVVGVAESKSEILDMLTEYYGEYEILSHEEINRLNILDSYTLYVTDELDGNYKVYIRIEKIELNKAII